MKKRLLKYLICLCMVLSSYFAVCHSENKNGDAAYVYKTTSEKKDESTANSFVEILFKGSLNEVLEYADRNKNGDGIVLKNDIVLNESMIVKPLKDTTTAIIIEGKVKIDLNGHFITQLSGAMASSNPLFIVPIGSTLIIDDSSAEGKGWINAVQNAVLVNGGTLSVYGGKIMAQSGAVADYDEYELPVKITNNGTFEMYGGHIDYSGDLTDGRTYENTSGAVYVGNNSEATVLDGKIFGEMICDDSSKILIYNGKFDAPVDKYILKEYECVLDNGLYTVKRKHPKAHGLYNDINVDVTVEAAYSKYDNSVQKYYVFATSETAYRKNTQIDLSDIIQVVSEFDEERLPHIEIATDAVTVTVSRETVQKLVKDYSGQKIFFNASFDDEISGENKKLLKTARRQVEYEFVDENGQIIDIIDAVSIKIPYFAEVYGDVIHVYSVENSNLKETSFEYSGTTVDFTADASESFLISDGYHLEILGKALDLQGTISLVYYTMPEGIDIENVKMLFWTSPQKEYTEETAESIVSATGKTANGYKFEYKNISSKDMNKEVYARLVAYTPQKEKIYSSVPKDGYSVRKYARNMMKDEKLKPLLVKMLNFGTAAQEYFGSEYENVNSFLSDGERAIDFTRIYTSQSKTITEQENDKCNAVIKGKTLMLDGDISIMYFSDWSKEKGYDEAGILFWTEDEYNGISEHIYGTETYRTSSFEDGGEYRIFSYPNIVSSAMNRQIYARLYVRRGSEYKYSDIDCYSVRDYAANQLAKNGDEKLLKLLRTMMLYGEEAEKYFRITVTN